MALAQSNPATVNAMSMLEGAEELDIRHKGKAMLAVLTQAEKAEVSSYPTKINRLDEYPGYKQIFKQVKAFLVKSSEQNNLAIENIASKKQINQFLTWQFDLNDARNNADKVDLISGWRNALFGQTLLEFAKQGYK